MSMKHVLTIQSKLLLDHFENNDTYLCKATREGESKYRNLQEQLGLPQEFYPIWVYCPSDTDYMSKGKLFENENFISHVDMEKGFMAEMLFHIGVGGLDYTHLKNLRDSYYLYEFVIDSDNLYDDTLEGYTICKTTPYLLSYDLVNVYSIGASTSRTQHIENPSILLHPLFDNVTSMSNYSITVPTTPPVEEIVHTRSAIINFERQTRNIGIHLPHTLRPTLSNIANIDFSLFDNSEIKPI